jgi:hypothetical protein
LECSAGYKEWRFPIPKAFGVAKGFALDVEKVRGAESVPSSNVKTELVEAKLEMVRAAWLLQHVNIVRRLCWLGRLDRV